METKRGEETKIDKSPMSFQLKELKELKINKLTQIKKRFVKKIFLFFNSFHGSEINIFTAMLHPTEEETSCYAHTMRAQAPPSHQSGVGRSMVSDGVGGFQGRAELGLLRAELGRDQPEGTRVCHSDSVLSRYVISKSRYPYLSLFVLRVN